MGTGAVMASERSTLLITKTTYLINISTDP